MWIPARLFFYGDELLSIAEKPKAKLHISNKRVTQLCHNVGPNPSVTKRIRAFLRCLYASSTIRRAFTLSGVEPRRFPSEYHQA
jgi:hypothetical protein